MYENKQQQQTAVLAAVDTGEYDVQRSVDELEELAKSAGAEVLGRMIQRKDRPDPATLMGAGRLEELADFVRSSEAELVIFDHELAPAQQKNIEKVVDVPVIDRTTLILDIFAQRAKTSAGRLQVELAQLKYRLPRLSGLGTSLSRLGGGIGTRGPGESKLESDRRHIRRRIHALEQELEALEKHRDLLRQRRKKDDVITVAIVGYTNVGKSTLLNTLTDAGVLAKDMLFATLDPTSRALSLPDGRKVMLIDTVGLVSRLPHQLVQAFHSTLEEAVVLNKCDKLPELPLTLDKKTAAISAKTGMGLEKLLEKIALNLPETHRHLHLLIPYDKSGLIGEIRQSGKVYTEEYREDGTYVDANVDLKLCHRVQEYLLFNEE